MPRATALLAKGRVALPGCDIKPFQRKRLGASLTQSTLVHLNILINTFFLFSLVDIRGFLGNLTT